MKTCSQIMRINKISLFLQAIQQRSSVFTEPFYSFSGSFRHKNDFKIYVTLKLDEIYYDKIVTDFFGSLIVKTVPISGVLSTSMVP